MNKLKGTNFISAPILSTSVHLTSHVHIHDCLSCYLAVNVLARLSEHFIILYSVSICSSAPFVSPHLYSAVFIFCFPFYMLASLHASVLHLSPSLLSLRYPLHHSSCPSRSRLPALPSGDHALITLQSEALPPHPGLLSCGSSLCPLSIRKSPDTIAPSLHLLYRCLPRFSLFPFLQPSSTSFIRFCLAPLIYSQNHPFIIHLSTHPFSHSSSQLLFLPTSPHPKAVGSKCRGDSA